MNATERVLRLVLMVAVLIGGIVHVKLYDDGYRDIANYALGRSFLANAMASGLVVGLLAIWRSPLAILAALGVAFGTLGAFTKSRIGNGIFGFTEHGLKPSPEALIALIAELIAVAAACYVLADVRRARNRALRQP